MSGPTRLASSVGVGAVIGQASSALVSVSNADQASRSRPILSQSVKGGPSPGNIGKCRTFNVASSQPSIWAAAATR